MSEMVSVKTLSRPYGQWMRISGAFKMLLGGSFFDAISEIGLSTIGIDQSIDAFG